MDPGVGRWALASCGDEVGPPQTQHCLGLKRTARRTLLEGDALLQNRHDAGIDAKITFLGYKKLLGLAGQQRRLAGEVVS